MDPPATMQPTNSGEGADRTTSSARRYPVQVRATFVRLPRAVA